MAANNQAKAFYYRMSQPFFHTLLIKSDILVVHEITNGPFVKDETLFGTFAPNEDADPYVIRAWQNGLADRVRLKA